MVSPDNVANWSKANKLTLNVKKSNLFLFDSRKNSKEKASVKLFIIMMGNLNKKTFQNS